MAAAAAGSAPPASVAPSAESPIQHIHTNGSRKRRRLSNDDDEGDGREALSPASAESEASRVAASSPSIASSPSRSPSPSQPGEAGPEPELQAETDSEAPGTGGAQAEAHSKTASTRPGVVAPAPSSAPTSRIRPKKQKQKNAADAPSRFALATTEVSNGKVVDARSSFATLAVAPWLIASLAGMAIRRPTAVQKACIPEILAGRDVIGGSRTGSGKTVAFAVPVLQRWAEDPMGIFAVVLTPTRELALQIFEQFAAISAPQSLKAVLITGGTEMRPQALALARRPHVVIATPGRLADHIATSGNDTIAGLRRTKVVVLDEADRLLAPGPGSMLPDLETCLGVLPPAPQRQTCLFTATLTPEVMALRDMPRPRDKPALFVCEVDPGEATAIPATLHQTYLQVPLTYREAYLHALLTTPRNAAHKAIIVFANRTATADLLERLLRGLEHKVVSLHSRLAQSDRSANLARFRASAARILVATDVASRGLDIPDVGLVVNFDVPRDPDDYIHRVGRTARAGRTGEAVTMVGQRDVALVLAIEERVGRQMVEYEEEGVNVETRVVRDVLKAVGEMKRQVVIGIDEGRDVKGNRVRGKIKKVT